MSSFKHVTATALLATAVIGLSGCGFTPVYADKSDIRLADGKTSVQSVFEDIRIENIPDREGQMLRNALLDRMNTDGRPTNPRFRLQTSRLVDSYTSLGIRRDATTTRAQVRVSARVRLVDTATGQPVLERVVRTVNGYNVLNDQFGTLVTREDARERSINELADLIVTHLSLFFASDKMPVLPPPAPAPMQEAGALPADAPLTAPVPERTIDDIISSDDDQW